MIKSLEREGVKGGEGTFNNIEYLRFITKISNFENFLLNLYNI